MYSTLALSVLFFSIIESSVLMALNFYYKDATHVQLLEKLRPITLAETCRFLTIQSLEFQEIWQKDSSETMQIIYHKKSEF